MSALKALRLVAFLEGASFLLLLLVAMPLKYGLHLPIAVRIAGTVHGFLFAMFAFALVRVASERHWPWRRSLGALVASLLPGGTFVFDRTLKREIEQVAASARFR